MSSIYCSDSTGAWLVTRYLRPGTVREWHVPPECQGQIVEVAYGLDEDGYPWMRAHDRSDDSVQWTELEEIQDPEDWEPWNREPALAPLDDA